MNSPFSVQIKQFLPEQNRSQALELTCHQAHKACMPSFVFSISGQVNFRAALQHLRSCSSRPCASLRKKVREGIKNKLSWLFAEDVLLGCIYVQPLLYKMNTIINLEKKENFLAVAKHLSHCPNESCARLRRSILLTIRSKVSPNTRDLVAD